MTRHTLLPLLLSLVVALGLASLLYVLGCAPLANWTPCPDRLHVAVGHQWGTFNGQLPPGIQTGEGDDNFDSDGKILELRGEMEFALGKPPDRCPTLGGNGE